MAQIHSEAAPDLEAGVVWSIGQTGAETTVKDFSVALVLEDAGEGVLIGEAGKWQVTRAGNEVRFEVNDPAVEMKTVAGGSGTVIISVKRDPRQALSGIWINGVERMSLAVAPGDLKMNMAAIQAGNGVKAARIYNRALSRGEVLEWEAVHTPQGAESVAWMGGSEACALYEDGRLEAALLMRGAVRRVRSLAWEGDTVFEQDRPMGFGSLKSQLDRVRAGEVWLMFGRQEALEKGVAGTEAFREALTKLVSEIRVLGRRVRLVGPAPLEVRAAPFPDLSAQTVAVAMYEQVMTEVAAATHVEMVEVQARWPKSAAGNFTRDGLTLSARGLELLAGVLAGAGVPEQKDEMVADVRAKNRLWQNYWRPTNWAFLHGDRTAQPSSRDHEDPKQRWFPSEMEEFKRLIETKEQALWKKVSELGRKLP